MHTCVGACMHGLELIVTCMFVQDYCKQCKNVLYQYFEFFCVCLSFRLCCTLQYELNFKYGNSCSIRKQTYYCPTPNREVTFSF